MRVFETSFSINVRINVDTQFYILCQNFTFLLSTVNYMIAYVIEKSGLIKNHWFIAFYLRQKKSLSEDRRFMQRRRDPNERRFWLQKPSNWMPK